MSNVVYKPIMLSVVMLTVVAPIKYSGQFSPETKRDSLGGRNLWPELEKFYDCNLRL